MSRRTSRTLFVGGSLLLAVQIFLLAEGSWLGWFVGDTLLLRYLSFELSASPLGLSRLWMVDVVVLVWSALLWWARGRLSPWLLVVPMIGAWGIGAGQWLAWRAFSGEFEARVTAVFDEAGRSTRTPIWAGVYGVSDLAYSRTAVAPDGRWAHLSGGCMGIYDISWGHLVDDGPFLRPLAERGAVPEWIVQRDRSGLVEHE